MATQRQVSLRIKSKNAALRAQLADISKAERYGTKSAIDIMRRVKAVIVNQVIEQRTGFKMEDYLPRVKPLRQALADALLVSHALGRLRAFNNVGLRKRPITFDLKSDVIPEFADANSDYLKKIANDYNTTAFDMLKNVGERGDVALRKALTEGLQRGEHIASLKERIAHTLDTLGITPANSYSIENIVRTQTHIAFQAGKWQAENKDPDISSILWGYEYNTVGDDRVRATHEELDGIILPKEDNFWKTHYPPNGYSCRCQAIALFDPEPINRPDDIPEPDKGFAFNPGEVFRGIGKVEATDRPPDKRPPIRKRIDKPPVDVVKPPVLPPKPPVVLPPKLPPVDNLTNDKDLLEAQRKLNESIRLRIEQLAAEKQIAADKLAAELKRQADAKKIASNTLPKLRPRLKQDDVLSVVANNKRLDDVAKSVAAIDKDRKEVLRELNNKFYAEKSSIANKIRDKQDEIQRTKDLAASLGHDYNTDPYARIIQEYRDERNFLDSFLSSAVAEHTKALDLHAAETRKQFLSIVALPKEKQLTLELKRVAGRLPQEYYTKANAASSFLQQIVSTRADRATEDGILVRKMESLEIGMDIPRIAKLKKRAYAQGGKIHMGPNAPEKVYVHEMVHIVEEYLGGYTEPTKFLQGTRKASPLADNSKVFVKARIAKSGKANVSMRAKYGRGYEAHEVGNEDSFTDAFDSQHSAEYAGKDYAGQNSTEILTMSVERMYENGPAFAAADPELFKFVIGQLQGDFEIEEPTP